MSRELQRVCRDVVVEAGLFGAAISVMTPDGGEALAATSGDRVQAVVELQFALGEGPTSDAYAGGRPVLVPALEANHIRWVGFTPAALASGVTGVYALPLGLGAIRLGVLTCYAEEERALTGDQVRQCLIAAETATELLLRSTNGHAGGAGGARPVPHPEVQESLHIRTEVYQAQGMLAVELHINLNDALARLRALAYTEGVDLNELARDLVSGRRPFPEKG